MNQQTQYQRTMTTVDVDLGERSYPIHIGHGLIAEAGDMIDHRLPGSKTVIITDENVAALHLEALTNSLKKAGIQTDTIIVAPGETSKSFAVYETVVDQILALRYERNDCVIGFGGGVVGDLAGFAAASVRRGMNFVQIPTSLLAQVDSSVGGKTGINSPHGKNLIGAFWQPRLVLIDNDLLNTLPKRELLAGYAEVAKYGLINKPDFFNHLEIRWHEALAGGPEQIDMIATACRAKADIVTADEREGGMRALLNLGHTFGHALEGFCQYDPKRLVHGEGVAMGLVLAHEFSNRLNHCDQDSVERVKNHLHAVGLPTEISDLPGPKPTARVLANFMEQDKKVERGALTFILSRGIGQSFIAKDVPKSELLRFLKEKLGE